MDKRITKVLHQIESNGFEAYIVGGYVRDYLLGIPSNDIDICTNAVPKELINIFNFTPNNNDYGSFRIRTDKYTFDITTYRSENNYVKRKPTTIIYINNLLEDLQRRDFTINAICLNSRGDIIDLLNGREDLANRVIKCIGNPKVKLAEDPLRILRAVRLSITLDFQIDPLLAKEIINNAQLIKTLSYQRKREELDKILISPRVKSGLKLLKDLNVFKYLEIDYQNLVPVNDICAMYSQINISNKYNFTKVEKNIINKVKIIIKKGVINNQTLYQYGLYINQLSGKILNIDTTYINELYNQLPIKSLKDLCLSYNDICHILNMKPSKQVKIIMDDVINLVLNNKLNNDRESIINYLKEVGEFNESNSQNS